MANLVLSSVAVSADYFDNAPYERTLILSLYTEISSSTAIDGLTSVPIRTLLPKDIFGNILYDDLDRFTGRWVFDQSVMTAYLPVERFSDIDGNPVQYFSGTTTELSKIETLTFKITAEGIYDASLETYTLYNKDIIGAIDLVDVYYDNVILLMPFDFKTNNNVIGVTITSPRFDNPVFKDPRYPQGVAFLFKQLIQKGGKDSYSNTYTQPDGTQEIIELYWDPDILTWLIVSSSNQGVLFVNYNEDFINTVWEPTQAGWTPVEVQLRFDEIPENLRDFGDASKYQFNFFTPPQSNVSLTNSDYKFDIGPTTGSLRCPGDYLPRSSTSRDYIYLPDPTGLFNFSENDEFTIEGWIKIGPTGLTKRPCLISKGTQNNRGGWTIFYEGDFLKFGRPWVNNDIDVPYVLLPNVWYHIAGTREVSIDENGNINGTMRLFVNGEQIGINTEANFAFTSTAANVVIGIGHDGFPFEGWLDDIRITKGVARYRSNFTPPLEPFKQRGFDPLDPLSGAVVGIYPLVYDSYPYLPNFPTVFGNYESTAVYPYFYRDLPSAPYQYNITVYPDPSVIYGTITSKVSTETFVDERTLSPTTFTFDSLTVPTVCAVSVTVCAISAPNSVGDFFTPHFFTNAISAVFFNYPGNAEFRAAPSTYFDEFGSIQTIPLPLTTSPGLSFYGEGHTEVINLVADSYPDTTYLWSLDSTDGSRTYPVTGTTATEKVEVNTEIGYYPEIAISLLLTNGYIATADGPLFYFDDATGTRLPYPFYYSTMLEGELNPNNSHPFKTNINVLSYGEILSSFDSGLNASNIFLPVDGSRQFFTANLNANLYGQDTLASDPCFDRYEKIWRWSDLTSSENTWNSVGPAGTQPKTWNNQGVNIVNPSENRSPVFCYGSSITWTLSTPNWSDSKIIDFSVNDNTSILPDYEYFLSFLSGGTMPYTTSIYTNTPVVVRGSQVVTCIISAFPFDWQAKDTLLIGTDSANFLSRGDIQIFTPNRYVLTGSEVTYNNLSPGFNNVDRIEIDTQGTPSNIILNQNQINNNFTVTYNLTSAGPKTVTATTYYNTGLRIIDRFPAIVTVLNDYDVVSPKNYSTLEADLNLPWPDAPYIAPNEWVTDDNINSVIIKFYENLEYLKTRGLVYRSTPTTYEGWAGIKPEVLNSCPIWTWEELDCTNPENTDRITWEDLECIDTSFPEITANRPLSACAPWTKHECIPSIQNPDCYGKHCVQWKWKSRTTAAKTQLITWKDTKINQPYSKKWMFEPCITEEGDSLIGTSCDKGVWNVNIPKLNTFYSTVYNCNDITKCNYIAIATYKNIIYAALPTEIKLLSSDGTLTFVSSQLTLDNFYQFVNIKNICTDSVGKLYVLDGTLSKIGVFEIYPTDITPWNLLLTWGGYGTSTSQNRFSNPNDLHIDSVDNIWVCDTGNKCIKLYSNTGTWIQTLKEEQFELTPPISLAVDSSNSIHVLMSGYEKIRVYTYTGTFLFEYAYRKINTTKTPTRINTNYNREIIYVIFEDEITRYFRIGTFAGFIPQKTQCAPYYTDVIQDEYRNLLITANNKIVKYHDMMTVDQRIGKTPGRYWSLQDLLIHKEEYVQNWVYNKTFQRLWDNIEMVRNLLVYENTGCRAYTPPEYTKDKILFGQNEIVTADTLNRNIEYLWKNFIAVSKYFDPNCFDNK